VEYPFILVVFLDTLFRLFLLGKTVCVLYWRALRAKQLSERMKGFGFLYILIAIGFENEWMMVMLGKGFTNEYIAIERGVE
jgi:hypothetical protein